MSADIKTSLKKTYQSTIKFQQSMIDLATRLQIEIEALNVPVEKRSTSKIEMIIRNLIEPPIYKRLSETANLISILCNELNNLNIMLQRINKQLENSGYSQEIDMQLVEIKKSFSYTNKIINELNTLDQLTSLLLDETLEAAAVHLEKMTREIKKQTALIQRRIWIALIPIIVPLIIVAIPLTILVSILYGLVKFMGSIINKVCGNNSPQMKQDVEQNTDQPGLDTSPRIIDKNSSQELPENNDDPDHTPDSDGPSYTGLYQNCRMFPLAPISPLTENDATITFPEEKQIDVAINSIIPNI